MSYHASVNLMRDVAFMNMNKLDKSPSEVKEYTILFSELGDWIFELPNKYSSGNNGYDTYSLGEEINCPITSGSDDQIAAFKTIYEPAINYAIKKFIRNFFSYMLPAHLKLETNMDFKSDLKYDDECYYITSNLSEVKDEDKKNIVTEACNLVIKTLEDNHESFVNDIREHIDYGKVEDYRLNYTYNILTDLLLAKIHGDYECKYSGGPGNNHRDPKNYHNFNEEDNNYDKVGPDKDCVIICLADSIAGFTCDMFNDNRFVSNLCCDYEDISGVATRTLMNLIDEIVESEAKKSHDYCIFSNMKDIDLSKVFTYRGGSENGAIVIYYDRSKFSDWKEESKFQREIYENIMEKVCNSYSQFEKDLIYNLKNNDEGMCSE